MDTVVMNALWGAWIGFSAVMLFKLWDVLLDIKYILERLANK